MNVDVLVRPMLKGNEKLIDVVNGDFYASVSIAKGLPIFLETQGYHRQSF